MKKLLTLMIAIPLSLIVSFPSFAYTAGSMDQYDTNPETYYYSEEGEWWVDNLARKDATVTVVLYEVVKDSDRDYWQNLPFEFRCYDGTFDKFGEVTNPKDNTENYFEYIKPGTENEVEKVQFDSYENMYFSLNYANRNKLQDLKDGYAVYVWQFGLEPGTYSFISTRGNVLTPDMEIFDPQYEGLITDEKSYLEYENKHIDVTLLDGDKVYLYGFWGNDEDKEEGFNILKDFAKENKNNMQEVEDAVSGNVTENISSDELSTESEAEVIIAETTSDEKDDITIETKETISDSEEEKEPLNIKNIIIGGLFFILLCFFALKFKQK